MLHITALALLPVSALAEPDYPRIANLWGCSPGVTEYDEWARYDLLVLGGGTPETFRRFAREVRERNEDIRLLGTAPLMNILSPAQSSWMDEEWYLRRPDGEMIAWWAGEIHVPNILIDDCVDALFAQTQEPLGEVLDDGTLDGIFYDSVVGSATWLGDVDTDRDGVADRPEDVDDRWRDQQNLFFDRLRARWPEALILANDVDFGHASHLNGRLFEGATLHDLVAQGRAAPATAIETLSRWMTESLQPGLTFGIMTHPIGWEGWRVGKGPQLTTAGELDRVRRDFRRMRTGLLTSLMTEAYYAYDVGTVWYGSSLWYAEYDAPLGRPLGPAREVQKVPPIPVLDWRAGDPVDAFSPSATTEVVAGALEARAPADSTAWDRLVGTDPQAVPLEPAKDYRIRAECEILEKPSGSFQFNVRTAKGGWQHHDKGVIGNAGAAGETWSIDVTVTLDDYDDYSVEWHLMGTGGLRLTSLQVELVGESYFIREFQGGAAILSGTGRDVRLTLDEPMRRLDDDEAPRHYLEIDDMADGFATEGAWERVVADGAHYGPTYRRARKPGERATWTFTAPSTGRYTLLACAPGGDDLTASATYSLGNARAVVDQSAGDGGWVELFSADLLKGQEYALTLRSDGAGHTAADAIRIESQARYNDGAMVEQVELAPYDGLVLLR